MNPLRVIGTGVAVGVLMSAPIGAVNLMTIQRVVTYGYRAGLVAGFGALAADVLFAAVAAFGIGAIGDFVRAEAGLIQLVGGLIVVGFGLRSLFAHPRIRVGPANTRRRLSGALTAFAMTITNPGTLIGFVAIFGALGDWMPDDDDTAGLAQLVAGVAIGAAAWWAALATGIRRVRDRLTDATLVRISRIAGGLLIVFGGLILARLAAVRLGLV